MKGQREEGFFYYDPRNGNYERVDTLKEAIDAANTIVDEYRDESPDGWAEEVELVEYGAIATMGVAEQVDRKDREDADPDEEWGSEFDYTCDYQLRAVVPAELNVGTPGLRDRVIQELEAGRALRMSIAEEHGGAHHDPECNICHAAKAFDEAVGDAAFRWQR